MSVVSFYKNDQYIYAVSDTLITIGDTFTSEVGPKIYENSYDKFLVGAVGAYKYLMDIEKGIKKDDFFDHPPMKSLNNILAKSRKKQKDKESNFEVLFGYVGDIYYIRGSGVHWKIVGDFYSIGTGAEFCMGAYEAIKDLGLEPEEMLTRITKASFPYCNSVGGNVVIKKFRYKE